jgi:2-phospho-L-lactate/phosphoenolpyruvate guanylyltransferase
VIPACWDVIVPLKGLAGAKSRLAGLGGRLREDLACAMALDTVEAVVRCPVPVRVHVVSDDERLAAAVRDLDAGVAVHRGAPSGVNAALNFAASRITGQGIRRGTAALLGDLPALHPADLGCVLERAQGFARAVVADLEGSGTTLLAAGPGRFLAPRFGPGSFARHLDSGAVPLDAPASVRRDVDVPQDLVAAARLGVGRRTAAVAARMLATGAPPRQLAALSVAGSGGPLGGTANGARLPAGVW